LQEFTISGFILPEFLHSLQQSNLDHLTHVTLEGNFLYRHPTTYRRIFTTLPRNSLENLSSRQNGIDFNMTRKLAQVLPQYRNLHSLCLAKNELSGKGLCYLFDIGQVYSHITTLDLSDCDLGDNGVGMLSNYLCRWDIDWTIQCLCLVVNDITDGGAMLLAKGLSHCPHGRLHVIDLSRNSIDNAGLRAMTDAAAISSLRELSLQDNRFDTDGVLYLSSRLLDGTLRSLQKLDLSGNVIGDSGVEWIAKAIRSSVCTLKELLLADTHISNRAVETLATALVNNSHLKRLGLDDNYPDVDRRGGRSFVKCLAEHNRTLVTLSLLDRTYDNHLLNDKLDVYLELNRCGWHHVGDMNIPHGMWPRIWAKTMNHTDLLYQFIRRRPDLLIVR
jgi:Ran GTPase-activating protein (RanGAP) involved in mRNA processing and transport